MDYQMLQPQDDSADRTRCSRLLQVRVATSRSGISLSQPGYPVFTLTIGKYGESSPENKLSDLQVGSYSGSGIYLQIRILSWK
jgi:hypothetical protein